MFLQELPDPFNMDTGAYMEERVVGYPGLFPVDDDLVVFHVEPQVQVVAVPWLLTKKNVADAGDISPL